MFPHTVHCEMIAYLERYDPEIHETDRPSAWLKRRIEVNAAAAASAAATEPEKDADAEKVEETTSMDIDESVTSESQK